jgi:hypothetical protein
VHLVLLTLKILSTLWPFVKEMFFAGKSVKDIILDNKMMVTLLVALALSIALNWITIGKIMEIAVARREDAESPQNSKRPEPPTPVPGPPDPTASAPSSSDVYQDTRKALDDIYKQRQHP